MPVGLNLGIVGLPNVGKSTLFNALTRSRDALVHDEPGVTRDRNYGVCRLDSGRPFVLVDTGGIAGNEEGLAGATARQSRAAAEEADLILFIVDGREGASALDDEILSWLRKVATPTFLVVNKTDGIDVQAALAEFARYGFRDMLATSSAHKQGIDALLARMLAMLPEDGDAEILDDDPERKAAVFASLDAMTDEELAAFARKMAHYRAEDVVRNALRESNDGEVRTRARKVLHELRKIPYHGPLTPMH